MLSVHVTVIYANTEEIMWVVVFASLFHCLSAYDVDLKKLDGLAKAKVESCGG